MTVTAGSAAAAQEDAWWRPDTAAMAWLATILAVFVFWALRSEASYQNDSITHYFLARDAWARPELALHRWGRPGFTIPYAIPALFGFGAVRLFSAVVATLTAFATVLLARSVRIGYASLVIPFLAFQPYFFRLGFDGLTEGIFALYLVVGLLAVGRGNAFMACVAFSLLPVTRWEGVLVLPLAVAFLPTRKRARWLPLLVGPLLLWNGYWAVALGDALELLFPFDGLLRGGGFTDYGNGSLGHYPLRYGRIVGPALFVASQVGFLASWRRRDLRIWHLIGGGLAAFYVLAYWKMPSVEGAMAGYLRHFVSIAPLLALFSLLGVNEMLRPGRSHRMSAGLAALLLVELLILRANGFAQGLSTPVILLLALVLLVPAERIRSGKALRYAVLALVTASTVLYTLKRVEPYTWSVEQETLREAVEDHVPHSRSDVPILAAQSWVRYFAEDLARRQGAEGRPFIVLRRRSLGEAPAGSLVFWDNHYSARFDHRVERPDLDGRPNYRLLGRYVAPGEDFVLLVFEKTASPVRPAARGGSRPGSSPEGRIGEPALDSSHAGGRRSGHGA